MAFVMIIIQQTKSSVKKTYRKMPIIKGLKAIYGCKRTGFTLEYFYNI